jgi:hypothetical protein
VLLEKFVGVATESGETPKSVVLQSLVSATLQSRE